MSLSTAFKESIRKPSYLVVLLVLLIGAVGINAATTAMKLHFRKEALPLRGADGLDALPDELGTWVAVPEPRRILDADLEHSLGTNKYLFRDYVDTATPVGGTPAATKAEVLALKDLPRKDREARLNDFRRKSFGSVVSFAATYYTGKVDTVPHVPDRCYVADGFQPSDYKTEGWNLGQYAAGDTRTAPVRFIDFEDQTARGLQSRCVSYFFHANGDYMDDPNKVRIRLQNLLEKYAYFAKIEVMTILPTRQRAGEIDPLRDKDRNEAAAGMKKFLTVALPELEKILPVMPGR
jgi:hypothetical protein